MPVKYLIQFLAYNYVFIFSCITTLESQNVSQSLNALTTCIRIPEDLIK